ncbi:hypothetical protein DD238_006166 [Peronospora effusa]|uniref:Uncharacterized protein n=1 Tax=Peronospora effusa TaxID=542832 RepID=A0A3M6VS10_9STRA|nr:hypothetical protein DD238_006166 [Peronospora effusa]RQM09525.1 hypothetical protein DD237_007636 [Peronospora effusa]
MVEVLHIPGLDRRLSLVVKLSRPSLNILALLIAIAKGKQVASSTCKTVSHKKLNSFSTLRLAASGSFGKFA